jgi:WD40 repeat protein
MDLAVANRNDIVLLNTDTPDDRVCLRGHTDDITSIAFSPDGQFLASSSIDRSIRVWDVNSQECLRVLLGHNRHVCVVRFSNDGQRLVSCSNDGGILIWNIESPDPIRQLDGHDNYVTAAEFSPNDELMASCSRDGTIRIWEPEARGNSLRTMGDRMYSSLKWSSDGIHILVSAYTAVQFWNAITGQLVWEDPEDLKFATRGVAYSPDESLFVTLTQKNFLVRDTRTHEDVLSIEWTYSFSFSILFTPDGSGVIIDVKEKCGAKRCMICIWDIQSQTCKQEIEFVNRIGRVGSMAIRPSIVLL